MKTHCTFYNMLLIISLMYQCIKIMLMGCSCNTGKDEAIRIGTNVHDILNDTIDEQIKDEVNKTIKFDLYIFLKISSRVKLYIDFILNLCS